MVASGIDTSPSTTIRCSFCPSIAALREKAEVDEEGFASDNAWLVQTAEHTYPDAPANLFKSLHSQRVKNTADVLVSFEMVITTAGHPLPGSCVSRPLMAMPFSQAQTLFS